VFCLRILAAMRYNPGCPESYKCAIKISFTGQLSADLPVLPRGEDKHPNCLWFYDFDDGGYGLGWSGYFSQAAVCLLPAAGSRLQLKVNFQSIPAFTRRGCR